MRTIFKGILFLLIVWAIMYPALSTHRGLATPTFAEAASAQGMRTTKVQNTSAPQKIVPIISVGSGLRLGGALVTGPNQSTLNRVVAVGQIDGNFNQSVRVRVLVPVSSQNVVQHISRVPGTSVIGLVDIKI